MTSVIELSDQEDVRKIRKENMRVNEAEKEFLHDITTATVSLRDQTLSFHWIPLLSSTSTKWM